MALPRLIVTGASGFIGRRVLQGLKEEYRIVGMARRSQLRCGAPFHENITWFQVDIGDPESVATAFRFVRDSGGADYVLHLAAHYDFTGDDHPEYRRTNVDGLRNVLEEARSLDLKRFIFASSVAACQFPKAGEKLTEDSPPDGEHIYAVTKRLGEEMLAEYDDLPSCIVRFAAMFSDWCEYAPMYIFMQTWLSRAWNSRILGGRGESAIPYLHIREIPLFFRRLLDRLDAIDQREVTICSPNSTVNHRQLFKLANQNFRGRPVHPICMPSMLARVGVLGRDLLGRLLGNRPFERPWMVKYIDWDLAVDASRTHAKLDWRPRARLLVERRVPFMVENLKTDPAEWHRRNQAALKDVRLRTNLRIHRLLEKHHDEIRQHFVDAILGEGGQRSFPSYQSVPREIMEWRYTVVLRHLLNAVRTSEKGVFTAYCRDLAAKRFDEGFGALEVCHALELLNDTCLGVLASDEEAQGLEAALREYLTMTVQFGCDQVFEIYEELGGEEIVVDSPA
jgi:nucleoside-diphosphate-sugar epimerase